MGIINSKNKQPSVDNTDIIIMKQMMQQMEQIINNQADALRRTNSKLGEVLFKMGKMDEQLHLNKINLRQERDKNTTILHTMIHLGLLEADIFNLTQSLIQNKMLPINSEGEVKAGIRLTRYNCSPDMPNPHRGNSN